ncbi:DUF6365 family protein [Bacillus thuringiensis]|uniref:DUF6365 family protein n=1 Tax=Bacillus thuringiensis TaxID=1428 RepID=UPI0020C3D41A|nr:DUF6365 family protein [Bacillus thuringiensis]
MKVLFIAPSHFSIGELHNALCLAKQIQKDGEVYFLTSEKFSWYASRSVANVTSLTKGLRQKEVIKQIIDSFQPDAIVLADYHNLFLESPIIDLDYLLNLHIPCFSIDSLAWGSEDRLLENKLFKNANYNSLKKRSLIKLPKIPSQFKLIRTCPVNSCKEDNEKIISVKLYKEALQVDEERKMKIRAQLGCGEQDKLIMIAKSSWANLLVKMRLMEKKQYNDAKFSYEYILQELLSLYLQDFPNQTNIKLIGVSDETKFVSMKNGGKIEFISLPFLHLEEYEQLLLSCDLFITDNITSCSMGKAVFGKIPVISLVNHMGYEELRAQRYSLNPTLKSIIEKWNYIIPNGLYPFLVFPNGWHKELAPLMEKNDYFNCVHTCEIFDLRKTSKTIFNMLYSKTEIEKLKKMQQLYIDNVCNLPTINDVIKRELGALNHE